MLTSWAKKLLLPSIADYILFALSNNNDGKKAFVTAKTVLNNNAYVTAFSTSHSSTVKIRSVNESGDDGIWIGTGDTPATENDYFLESPITSGCTGSATSETKYDAETNSMFQRIVITISNTGNSDLVIKEICKTCVFDTATGIGVVTTSNRKNIMIDRTVLDTPVTIPAGTAGVIYYDFVYHTDASNAITTRVTSA